jgi:hypothetical protein
MHMVAVRENFMLYETKKAVFIVYSTKQLLRELRNKRRKMHFDLNLEEYLCIRGITDI